jgi:hypothetical protein
MADFWDNTPYILVEIDRHFTAACSFQHQSDKKLINFMMETIRTSETSASFYKPTPCCFPGGCLFLLTTAET